MVTIISALRLFKLFFNKKRHAKETVQIAVVLTFNETAITKIALHTYPRLRKKLCGLALSRVLADDSIVRNYG